MLWFIIQAWGFFWLVDTKWLVSRDSVFILITRMHSSRMHTGRSLTVFRSLLIPGGGGTCLVQGGYLPGPGGGGTCLVGGVVYLAQGGYLPGPRGGMSGLVRYPPPWTEWMTDRCKNITLAKTSFRPVIILRYVNFSTILVSFFIYFLYGRFTILLSYIFSWNVVGLIRTTIGMKTNILIVHRRVWKDAVCPFRVVRKTQM